MYAYGGSALQAALLRLFVRCEAVLPGLWVGTLTRESIIGAPHAVAAEPCCLERRNGEQGQSSAADAAAAGMGPMLPRAPLCSLACSCRGCLCLNPSTWPRSLG